MYILYQHYSTICTCYTNTIQLYVHVIPTLYNYMYILYQHYTTICTFYTNTIHMYILYQHYLHVQAGVHV